MTLHYFVSCQTLQDLKKLYFKLAQRLHPDHGGDLESMKTLNSEYDFLKSRLPNAKQDEKMSEQERKKTYWQYHESAESMSAFRDILSDLLSYPSIVVEIIGSWLWISGKGTFAIRQSILYDKYNCKYSKTNKKFYWFSGIEKMTYKPRGGYLNSAILKYGIERFESEKLEELDGQKEEKKEKTA